MQAERKNGQTRRDQILEAAFAQAHANERWSLAEVAERIGMSKTAIYRHFKNRAEIESAMENQFRTDFARTIESSKNTPDGIRTALASFFRNNPGALYLFMHNIFTRPEYERELHEWLNTASPRVAAFTSFLERCDAEKRESLEIALLKNGVSIIIASFHVEGIESLQDDLLSILKDGLPGLRMPSSGRLDELEKISRIENAELENGNRLFDALAAAIRECGITKTTIERIAEKMGTAKSSLYFYYRNKGEMLRELIKNETDTIVSLCARRAAAGKNLAEQIFIVMSVQTNYLLLKPDMFPVFNWIRYETMKIPPGSAHPNFDAESFLASFHLDDFYPDDPDRKRKALALLKWSSSLSTSLALRAQRCEENNKNITQSIRIMFSSMMNGDKEIQ